MKYDTLKRNAFKKKKKKKKKQCATSKSALIMLA